MKPALLVLAFVFALSAGLALGFAWVTGNPALWGAAIVSGALSFTAVQEYGKKDGWYD